MPKVDHLPLEVLHELAVNLLMSIHGPGMNSKHYCVLLLEIAHQARKTIGSECNHLEHIYFILGLNFG